MTTDPLNIVQDNPKYSLPPVNETRYYVIPASRNGYVNGHSIDNMVDALGRYKLTPKQQRASDEAKQRFNPNIKW